MYKRIMIAYDGSESAKNALNYVEYMLPHRAHTELDIVAISNYTVPTVPSWYGIGADFQPIDPETIVSVRDEHLKREQEQIVTELKDILDKFDDYQGEIKIEVLTQGLSIADTLLDYATENECDLIVMGCRGLGALRGAIGSVSYAILRSASMPVMVVK